MTPVDAQAVIQALDHLCPVCHGSGRVKLDRTCGECEGKGHCLDDAGRLLLSFLHRHRELITLR